MKHPKSNTQACNSQIDLINENIKHLTLNMWHASAIAGGNRGDSVLGWGGVWWGRRFCVHSRENAMRLQRKAVVRYKIIHILLQGEAS